MGGVFGQLWYTWAIHGLDGRSRLQVRGISPMLLEGDPRIVEAARRLCRYESPPRVYDPREAPVSFGWIDWGEYRFIFRRAATISGPQGQPPAFGAHILVGPANLCPLTAAARLWGASMWKDIDDGETELEMDTVDPLEVAATAATLPAPGTDLLEHFLAAVLESDRQQRTVIVADAVTLAAVAQSALGQGPPHLMDGVSFSTYEPVDSSSFFNICGVHPDGGVAGAVRLGEGRLPDAAGRAAAAIVRSGDWKEVRAAAVVASYGGGAIDRNAFVNLHEALAQLQANGQIDSATLAAVVSTIEGLTYLLDDEKSRSVLAYRLACDDSQVARALRGTARSVDQASLGNLGAAVAKAILAADYVDGRLVGVLEAIHPALFEGWAEGLRKAMTADPSLSNRFDSEVRRSMLRHLAARQVHRGAVLDALLATPASQLSVITEDTAIPLRWRITSLRPHLGSIIGDEAALRMLSTETSAARELAESGAPAVFLGTTIARLNSISRNKAALDAASARWYTDEDQAAIILAAAGASGPEGALKLFQTVAHSNIWPVLAVRRVQTLAISIVVETMRERVVDGHTIDFAVFDVLVRCQNPQADTLSRLLETCGRFGSNALPETIRGTMKTACELLRHLAPDYQVVASEYIFRFAAIGSLTSEQFFSLADGTARYAGGGLAEARRCLQVAASNFVSVRMCKLLVLRAGNAIATSGESELDFSSQHPRVPIGVLAAQTKRRMNPETVREIEEEFTTKAARKWWAGVPDPPKPSRRGRWAT